MKNKRINSIMTFCLISLTLIFITSQIKAEPKYKGPYTISVLNDGVFHIEDANESNPAGMHVDKEGRTIGSNNCSDMYLVVGKDKALLIDLSNAINWNTKASESLRSVVSERTGTKELFITITHNHGDHTGMLPAFRDNTKVTFWIPETEFKNSNIFPKERTTFFAENSSLDLGGDCVINTMEVPGHTAHSTIFFLKNKNIVFTGDAIGSGNGVWLFNYDSFITYKKGIENLIDYIKNPANNIDQQKLIIYGGHYWQKRKPEELTTQYVYDMQTLIDRIGKGTADSEKMSAGMRSLDTNFKYGSATITWNKESAAKYADSLRSASR